MLLGRFRVERLQYGSDAPRATLGQAWITWMNRGHGLMLRSLEGRREVRWLRPEGFESWGPVHAVALAPGGRRAAVLAGGALYLLEW